MHTTARFFSIVLLSLGLITGCATTSETASGPTMAQQAQQAISDAKASNAQAKSLNYEWRDTGKIIKKAEAALAAGDNAKALKLANLANAQAKAAIKQAKFENQKYLNTMSVSYDESDAKNKNTMAGKVDSYEVVRGDNLWDISAKDEVYANPYQWPLIYKTNRDKIKDADLIYPGQVLDIDQNATASEINAAINHAKTRGAWTLGDTEQSDLDYLAK